MELVGWDEETRYVGIIRRKKPSPAKSEMEQGPGTCMEGYPLVG